jgi:hypothetical protein
MTLAISILALISMGIIIEFFISTRRAFKKFDSLDSAVQEKLLAQEYYMAVVRNVSKEDLDQCLAADKTLPHNGRRPVYPPAP